jgi:hypothetical protein
VAVAAGVAVALSVLDYQHLVQTAMRRRAFTLVKMVKITPTTVAAVVVVAVGGKVATVGQFAATMLEHLLAVLV